MLRGVHLYVSLLSIAGFGLLTHAAVERKVFRAGESYLAVEVLHDDVLHFEYAAQGEPAAPIFTSLMVGKTDYSGASTLHMKNQTVETQSVRAEIHPVSLCLKLTDKLQNRYLTEICPFDLDQAWKGLTLDRAETQNIYGLGQELKAYGTADGDWITHGERRPGYDHGNGFVAFGRGMNGNAQFPVMYALGPQQLNYALFLDNVYRQEWNFQSNPWRVQMWGDQIRFYVFAGPDLATLRSRYMELVGRPPVPPRKAFGLWVSEFGFENWKQMEEKKESLRHNQFPLDGFVTDLQWFGGVKANDPNSRMGALDWDRSAFPDPESKLKSFHQEGIGIITIEESYVAQGQSSFTDLARIGGLARNCLQAQPVLLTEWFGLAGLIDWSHSQAANYWHDSRRQKNLVNLGVMGHWTDLGEPEKYDPAACYAGVEPTKNRHPDIHNIYNLLWNKSIYDGYVRHQVKRRPFIVTRSGAPGVQRFGAVMWSGDIASDLNVLATHSNAQMHMSFSGVDYYGADIGGFRREALPDPSYTDELYTQWFANATWFDIPVRPHVDNSFQCHKCYETSPDRVGRRESNLQNLRRRYELTPYYYSLAYRAHLYGEPLMPPPLFYDQADENLRQIGHQKHIGRDLLVGIVAKHGEYARRMYLPRGRWIHYYTHDAVKSRGEWTPELPVYEGTELRLPVFVREGAILPKMHVDEYTQNIMGQRRDGQRRDDLIVEVYPSSSPTEFSLYEDDGLSITYDANQRPVYEYRTTPITQTRAGDSVVIQIGPAQGDFAGAVHSRINEVRVIVPGHTATTVALDEMVLPQFTQPDEFERAEKGWINVGPGKIRAKSPRANVSVTKSFRLSLKSTSVPSRAAFACHRGFTQEGEDVYVTGSVPELGQWDLHRALKLSPSVYYPHTVNDQNPPVWTGVITGLPGSAKIEWKCVKRTRSGEWQWEPGPNNILNSLAAGYSGMSEGSF